MKKAAVKSYSETIQSIDFSLEPSQRKEYEDCEFIHCTFDDLSNMELIGCRFTNCNLSNVKLNFCGMQDVEFNGCKLMGADFCPTKDFLFSVTFKNCILDYVSFDRKNMNRSVFENCKIHGANFTQADLSKSSVLNCDFHEAVFSGTNLSGLDFTTCKNFLIDPELNVLKKTKFSKHDLTGLLYRHDIIIE